MARRELFSTLRTEGGLLPPDFIRRLAEGASGVPGLRPADYHLVDGEKLSEAASRAWNRLQPAWAAFQKAVAGLPEGDPATGITREKWLQPLFHELGYGRLLPAKPVEIEEKQYPVSHSWQRTPIHLVGCGVDLDRRTAGVVGAAKASPHSLVQELLNRSDDHLWGIVSNGLRLRLLRDNRSLTRQAYVEFDLAAMLEGQVYADFALLFLLLHQSRVEAERAEECWLESWAQAAAEQGTRALDRLRSGVEEAITALGRGFLAHSTNVGLRDRLQADQLDRQDYYRQLLRLVYRLIFLFVAEDREVLHAPAASDQARARYRRYYSTRRLRDLAQSRRGTAHGDLWQALGMVMRGLGSEAGVPAMGLPALGSFLWSDDALPDLQGCQLANTSLLQAVRSLATSAEGGVLQVVDYRNLGPEELGSVYEALLEQHPEVNAPAGTFDLKTAAGHERKTTGSYYTPTSLIECLLDSALDPVLVEAALKPDPEKAILDLKVCDPACGSGHFLIAAAHRMARRLAAVRTGDAEPAPEAIRTALRDVIGRCLHGVDINPMAVELCKVNLWLEALDPGKPLSFLDHHIQCGNSLLGATPELIEKGIPDEAFEALEGDDKAICRSAKARNKKERGGQRSLLSGTTTDPVASLARAVESVEQATDGDLPATQAKARLWENLLASPELRAARLVADAWCAAFVAPRSATAGMQTVTQGVLELLRSAATDPKLVAGIDQVAREYQLFHWHLAFPAVFARGGFDVVLGNPPWERLKLQEQEFFAERHPGIAAAPNAAARGRMIKTLAAEDPGLYASFQAARRRAEGESALVRQSGRYPLCGRGDVNTYAVFSELNRSLLGPRGRAGFIVPIGIATDDTTKAFFQVITGSGSLVSFHGFENEARILPGVHHAFKFGLLTITAPGINPPHEAVFSFFHRNPTTLPDRERQFNLSAGDIALLNPDTKTCPIFRTRRDAELTKAIYRRVPVLLDEDGTGGKPWVISVRTRLWHMAEDSEDFATANQLASEGWVLSGNTYRRGQEAYLPLYEAKLIHHFTHRYGDYAQRSEGSVNTTLPEVSDGRLADPYFVPSPHYWVPAGEVETRLRGVWTRGWLLGWRDICRSTDARTLIAAIMPRVAVGHTVPLLMPLVSPQAAAALLAVLSSFVLDYVVRQKLGGTHLSYVLLRLRQ